MRALARGFVDNVIGPVDNPEHAGDAYNARDADKLAKMLAERPVCRTIKQGEERLAKLKERFTSCL